MSHSTRSARPLVPQQAPTTPRAEWLAPLVLFGSFDDAVRANDVAGYGCWPAIGSCWPCPSDGETLVIVVPGRAEFHFNGKIARALGGRGVWSGKARPRPQISDLHLVPPINIAGVYSGFVDRGYLSIDLEGREYDRGTGRRIPGTGPATDRFARQAV